MNSQIDDDHVINDSFLISTSFRSNEICIDCKIIVTILFNDFHKILNIANVKFEDIKMRKEVLASFEIVHCIHIVATKLSILIVTFFFCFSDPSSI